MKIGIIDSGKGALAISRYLKEEVIVLMDISYFPYGNKSKEFLCKRCLYLCDYLINKGVDIIILGCNTLSIYALDFVRNILNIKIFGVFEYIKEYLNTPNIFIFRIFGVFEYIKEYLTKDNLFIGTKKTIEYVKNNYDVNVIDGSRWIEDIQYNKGINNMINYLSKTKYNNIILGCTHFLMYEYPFKVVQPIKNLLVDIKKEEPTLKKFMIMIK